MFEHLPAELPSDPRNRPWADPKRGYDDSEQRMRRLHDKMARAERDARERTEALAVLEQLRARGVSLSVQNGTLWAGPRDVCVNGTRQKIEQWRDWFVILLSEETAA